MTCGWPGDVRVEDDHQHDDGYTAYWSTDEDPDKPEPFCHLSDCDYCRGREAEQ